MVSRWAPKRKVSGWTRFRKALAWSGLALAAARPDRTTRPDVQAAATVIGRRTTRHDVEPIVLTAAILARANLGPAHLHGAVLAFADLTGTNLTGANLRGAYLTDAILALTNFRGANLTGANLTGALWPTGVAVPKGWQRDIHSGRLKRAATSSE